MLVEGFVSNIRTTRSTCVMGSGLRATRERDPALRQVGRVDADDALAIARSRTDIDVLLSDIVMPGEKSGIDLMRALRELYPGLPVVLASGYATALAEPLPVPVVAKPYDVAEIARLLAQQIGSTAR